MLSNALFQTKQELLQKDVIQSLQISCKPDQHWLVCRRAESSSTRRIKQVSRDVSSALCFGSDSP